MGSRFHFTVTIVAFLLATGQSSRAFADETSDLQEAEQTRINKELVEKSVNDVQVFPDGETEEPLKPQVVLRWQNPVRVYTGAAVLAVWPHNGRPEAMSSVYLWSGDLCHEFSSLSRVGKLTTHYTTGVRSSLRDPGVEFKTVPDAPAPADTPSARLRQMKSIAERFTAKLANKTKNNENIEDLRLLPKPVYRYEIKEGKSDSSKVFDGAMFAYVMGTDPEVVLLLEAVGSATAPVWQYAFAIATTHNVEAMLDEKVVWSRIAFGHGVTNAEVFLRRKVPE